MIHIGLFEGIGGFSIAAHQMGWDTLVTCEIAEFPRKVLQYYWPQAYHHDDIHTLNYDTINDELSRRFGEDWRSEPIICTGGFPCQPYSTAGKRLGKDDSRHLWPEMLRVIREVKPRWVVGENVRGLVSWNGGLVFDEVQADLEAEGYQVQPFLLPAASVNAPHRRDRIWFVAWNSEGTRTPTQREVLRWQNSISNRVCGASKEYDTEGFVAYSEQRGDTGTPRQVQSPTEETDRGGFEQSPTPRESIQLSDESSTLWGDAPDTTVKGLERGEWRSTKGQRLTGDSSDAPNPDSTRWRESHEKMERKSSEQFDSTRIHQDAPDSDHKGLQGGQLDGTFDSNGTKQRWEDKGQPHQATPQLCEVTDWEFFPTQSPICSGDDELPSKLVGITFSKWRNESIKAYGNAVVPALVLQIFRAIEQYEQLCQE